MVGTRHDTLVQTHGMYNTMSEPSRKLWTLGNYDVNAGLLIVTKVPLWRGMLMVREAVHMWRHGRYGISILSSQLYYESKSALKKLPLKKQTKKPKNWQQINSPAQTNQKSQITYQTKPNIQHPR